VGGRAGGNGCAADAGLFTWLYQAGLAKAQVKAAALLTPPPIHYRMLEPESQGTGYRHVPGSRHRIDVIHDEPWPMSEPFGFQAPAREEDGDSGSSAFGYRWVMGRT
jgi:hypothetical protein